MKKILLIMVLMFAMVGISMANHQHKKHVYHKLHHHHPKHHHVKR